MHECVCVCVCVCVMSNKVDTLSSYPTPLGSVCHVRLVPASMSCTVCLCRRSQLMTRPGLSPVLPAPAVSAHLWCQHLPLQQQPQICGLTRQGQLCLVWCWACQPSCLWWVLYMCVEGSVHVCVCIHVHMCMYCYCTHTYSINLCHLLHTVLYGCL